jgi:hypothetical protein
MSLKIIIGLLIAFLLFSCTEKYDVGLIDAKTNRLVVEGSLTSEYKIHHITLSRTGSYFLNEPTVRETGAILTISGGDTLIHLVDSLNNGVYKTDKLFAGKAGNKYSLNIQLKSGETYSASELMKPINPIDSVLIQYKKSDIPFDESYYYTVNLFAQEHATKGECYQWELFLDDKHISDTIRTKSFVTDELVNGAYIANFTVYQLPEYKIDKDTMLVRLQMLSISKEKYDYYMAILLETDFSGAGFTGPPANVPTNISNGALGFFSVSDVTEIKKPLYRINTDLKSKK